MSENENLNEQVDVEIDDATVITVPIDATLSNSNEAADAKAVGDALALKADKSELSAAITVNGQSADSQGVIIVTANDTKMSSTDNTTIKAKIEAVDGKTANDIMMSSASGAKTIAQELADSEGRTAENITMSSSSQTTVAQKIGTIENVGTANSEAIEELKAKTGADIAVSSTDSTKISDALNARIKTVNGECPDSDGNVQVQHALTADNLTSNASQNSTGEFVRRTSGGSASISTGSAWLSTIRGNRTHVGYVPEVLNMTVNAAPREQGETPITATIDRDVFVAAVSGSTTISLTYTISWSADPATYGVTVTGTPVSGDQITIVYTEEDRGTIIQSDPQTFVSTGWNLFNSETGYAIGLKYDDTANFRIMGTYTAVKFSSTIDGAKTTITPVDGLFSISANGYIWVEGSSTDTAVYMTWYDWVLAEDAPTYEAYSEDVVDLSDLMDDHFPYGLLRVADIRDEIDFNTGIATSKVQRLSYSAENLETAIASGLAYECDTNYIYLERASALEYDLDDYELSGMYNVNDHGLEYYTGSSIAVYSVIIYGNNLKNKLERDVLTKSADLVNNLTTNDATKALSAAQGYALNSNINNIIGKYVYDQSGSIETYLGTLPSDKQWVATVTNNSSTGSLVTLSGQHLFSITQFCSSDSTKYQIAVAVNTPYVYYRIYRWYNSSWSDWYELERKIQVVSTGSKTISGNGNISYTFENKVLVLGAYSTSSDIVCSVYPSSGADSSGSATWWIHCRNANSSGSVASGTITCYIIYIK